MGAYIPLNSASIISALGFTPASINVGANGVGSMQFLVSSSSVASGNTLPGSSLADGKMVNFSSSPVGSASVNPPGTWKNISGATINNTEAGMFQRIA